jgi:hypothetical protein
MENDKLKKEIKSRYASTQKIGQNDSEREITMSR